jgi:hypothetical protein
VGHRKYVLCPLRWHALSLAGKNRRWHLRAYAESELLGLVTPGHAGADLWRIHRLENVGRRRPCAVAEVGLDRLVGAVGLTAFVVIAGASLPVQLLLAAIGIALTVILVGLVMARLRPDLLPRRPLPTDAHAAAWDRDLRGLPAHHPRDAAGSGARRRPHRRAARPPRVFGAAQVAGIIPGVHGASPREGALVVGLATLGVPWGAALGAVALLGLLAWARPCSWAVAACSRGVTRPAATRCGRRV